MPRVWKQEAISNCEGTTFEKNRLRRLKTESRVIEPTIWIGKEGLSQQLIQHVQNQLKARELVKVKLQKSALTDSETESVAKKTSGATGSIIVDVIGHTFTLYKKKSESGRTIRGVNTIAKRLH
jgi:RNA-binding protein